MVKVKCKDAKKKNKAILLNKFDCYFEQVIKKINLYKKKGLISVRESFIVLE